MSKRTRRAYPLTNNALFSPTNNLRMGVLSRTTTSRRNQPSISFSIFVTVCRYLSRHSLARGSRWRLSLPTPSITSRRKSKTRRAYPLTKSYSLGLQHPEGIDPPSRSPSSWRYADIRQDDHRQGIRVWIFLVGADLHSNRTLLTRFLRRRAWRKAHVPSATMRLVSHYLPSDQVMSEKPVWGTFAYNIKSIGGPCRLAQLYLEARLLH